MRDNLKDALRRALKTGGPCYTHFLDPETGRQFADAARNSGLVCESRGGAQDAEREMYACWMPGYEPEAWPLAALDISWDRRAGQVAHRDILGAVVGLGIQRDHIGDVRVEECRAWVAAQEGIATYIENNLLEAGRVAVRVERAKTPLPRPRGRERTINPMSLRLDAVLAAALNISRARGQELVRSGRVSVNWREETRTDFELAPGDTISIRGQGRVVLQEMTGQSRKGRLYIGVETYLGNRA